MADFDFDLGTAASGAASGAAVGSSFGPVGTAVGAGAGFLSGFLGDDDENGARERAIDENRERLRALTSDLEAARDRSPTETDIFQAGAGALQAQSERQARQDRQQSAARGLGGSQFAVALDENRARQQGEGLRALVRAGAEADRRDEARLFEAQQRQREALNALLSDQAQAQTRRQARQNQALQGVFQSLPAVMNRRGREEPTQTDTAGGLFSPGAGTVA
jgi:hypothetical protein